MKTFSRLTAFISLASALFMIAIIVAGFLLITVSKNLPKTDEIKGIELKIPLRVYSADGFLISEFGNERRNPLKIKQFPETLKKAVLASEDDNFYSHRGIDITGLVRAALSNMKSDGNLQGASTITMQVARNFFLSREQTYERKLKEVLLSFKLERLLSKDEILSLYLNKIFLGHRAYGFGAAANVYYGKQLNELSLAEIAMLAGLPKAPSSNNPLSNPKRAINRRNYVLNRMHDLGHISPEQYKTAKEAPITAEKHGSNVELPAYHIAEMVRSALIDTIGEQAYWEGINVHTTILSEPQKAAIKSLRRGLQDYDKRHGYRGAIKRVKFDKVAFEANQADYLKGVLAEFPNSQEQEPAIISAVNDKFATASSLRHQDVTLYLEDAKWAKRFLNQNTVGKVPTSMTHILNPGDIVYIQPKQQKQQKQATDKVVWELSQIPVVSGALISMDPNTGKILSLVGGYDFFLNKYNRAVQAIRQPGSNIKPFIYSAGIDQGFTPASLISGAPIVMTDPVNGTVWRPENYSGEFYGPTRMRRALAQSMNLVSIRILRAIGIPVAREYLERFGLKMNRFSSSLTMALGSGGVTPLELISSYAALANTGYRIEPYFIERITDRNGKVLYQTKPPILCDECYQQYLPQIVDENTQKPADVESKVAQSTEQQTPVIRQITAPRIMSRANNFLTVNMLKDVITRGTARKALTLKRTDLAGKTGTTNDYVDAWFTGFNQKIVTTVWVGFDDPSTMGRGEAGSRSALPIWVDYMSTALKGVAEDSQELPEFIGEGWVDSVTSRLTEEGAPNAIEELYPIKELLPEPFARINGYTGETLDPNDVNPVDELNQEDAELLKDRIIDTEEDTDGLF